MNCSPECSEIWRQMLDNIREDREISNAAIDLWFVKFYLHSLSADMAVFATDTETKCELIANKFTSLLSEHLERVVGFGDVTIKIICDPSLVEPLEDEGIISPLRRMRELKAEHEALARERSLMEEEDDEEEEYDEDGDSLDFVFDSEEDVVEEHHTITIKETRREWSDNFDSGEKMFRLNEDYTFENFIKGDSNMHAHAAAVAVAESPGLKELNPLFLYGNSGIGKTHLMYAIANRVIERDDRMRVIYVKGEDFMNELIKAIGDNKTLQFRNKYRRADMLLIDDIQFIAGKRSTQLEFFHTFDALLEDKKQIIITSDKPPHEMATLEERIRSRVGSGVIVDIQPPDFELRKAIIKRKAEDRHLAIPDEYINILAERLTSNIRQVEGAINSLGAKHFLTGAPITMEMVMDTITRLIGSSQGVDLAETIIKCVAKQFGTTSEKLKGPDRRKEIKTPRNIAMLLLRDEAKLTAVRIGELLGRDYSTVLSNIKTMERDIENDSVLSDTVEAIKKEINQI